MAPLKHISWNVNGIRAVIGKGFVDILKKEAPDVMCLQETKAHPDQVQWEVPGYHAYWHAAEKKGYSGTLVLTRQKPLSVETGLEKLDNEGRVLTLEFADYHLVNVYVPNVKRDLSRLPFRQNEWDPTFLKHIRKLDQKKPVLFCGDMNVAHQDVDLANPKANKKNAGFTPEERQGFQNILDAGFVDTFRLFEKQGGHYSWWTWRNNARERNIGWRIDYFVASTKLQDRIKQASILNHIHGSDHCPVQVELAL